MMARSLQAKKCNQKDVRKNDDMYKSLQLLTIHLVNYPDH